MQFFFIFSLFNKINKAGKGAVRWPQVKSQKGALGKPSSVQTTLASPLLKSHEMRGQTTVVYRGLSLVWPA